MVSLGKIFSIGYQKRSVTDLVKMVKEAGVDIVVDVRETPWSYRREFAKTALMTSLHAEGIEYQHAKFAGNPKEIRRNARDYDECLIEYSKYIDNKPELLQEFDETVGALLREGKNICLVCYERHPNDCHRAIVIDRWLTFSRQSLQVTHLGKNGAERLSSL